MHFIPHHIFPWQALDPDHNLQVGARILATCYRERRDRWDAVGCYHAPNNRKFARRYRVQVIAGALLLLSLLAGVVGTTIFAVQSQWRQRKLEAGAYATHLRSLQERIDNGRIWGVEEGLDDTPAEPI